jgi:lipoyl(octanoyl) transferase
VSKWIAYHGFAINVNNDLSKYKSIIPCGITDKEVTSLEKINNQNYDNLKNQIINNFIKNLEI